MCERNHFHHVKPNSSSLQWPFSISNHNDRSLQCDKCLHWRQSPPRTTTCSLLRWWSAHWPKSLTYLILSAWMCVCGPALWLCARIKPMEQLCELSWVRALHVKLSPRQPPPHPPTLRPRPSSLLLSLHQLRSQGYYRSWKSQIKGAILTYFQIFTLHPILEVGLAQFTTQRLLFLFAEVKFWKDNWYPCILINVDLFIFFFIIFFF